MLVNLIEYVRQTNSFTLEEAVRLALRQVVGAYAIAVIENGHPQRIIAARQSSPMVIGIGEGEYFLSSDAASIIDYTNDFAYLNDGEIAVIEKDKPLEIKTLDNEAGHLDIPVLNCPSPSSRREDIRISCSRKSTSSPIPSLTASGAESIQKPSKSSYPESNSTKTSSSEPDVSSL